MSDTHETSVSLLSLQGVSKSYAGFRALQDVDLELRAGDAVAVVGANGAGKSTLVKILAGEFDDYSGRVLARDSPVLLTSPTAAIRNRIAVVQQAPDIVGSLSVLANIFLGLESRTISTSSRQQADQLDLFSLVAAEICLDVDPRQQATLLQADELQLVRVARALVRNPRILVLDEATTGLRPPQADALKARLMSHCDRGGALLFVTHNLREALTWCRHVVVVRDGRFAFTTAADSTTPAEVEIQMFGEQSDDTPEPTPEIRHQWIELVDISTDSLERVSLTVGAGERVGIVCGNPKSRKEMVSALAGAARLRSGQIRIDKQALALKNPATAARSGIALVPGDRFRDALFPTMSAADNIALAILDRLGPGAFLNRRRLSQAAAETAERLSIRGELRQPIATMSGGNQQKCVIARSIISTPKLLLLEEPFAGIDISSRVQVCRALDDLRSSSMSTLVFSDNPDDLWQLSDRFVVIGNATVKRVCSRSNTTRDEIAHELSGRWDTH